MISLIKATFMVPLRVLAQALEATATALSEIQFLVGVTCFLAAAYVVISYLNNEPASGRFP